MNKLVLLAGLLFSAQSFAAMPRIIKCNNGHLEDDQAFEVAIKKSGIDFNFWEGQLVAERVDLVASGNSIAIVDKKLKGSAEGDTYTARTSALLVYEAKTKQLVVTMHLDGRASRSAETLQCK